MMRVLPPGRAAELRRILGRVLVAPPASSAVRASARATHPDTLPTFEQAFTRRCGFGFFFGTRANNDFIASLGPATRKASTEIAGTPQDGYSLDFCGHENLLL